MPKGKFEALEKLEDPNLVFHIYALDQELKGFEAHKQYILALQQACPGIFPDWRYVTGDGNLFTLLLKMSGARFTGQAPGFPPPSREGNQCFIIMGITRSQRKNY